MAEINEEAVQDYLDEQMGMGAEEEVQPVATEQTQPEAFQNWDSYTADPEYQTLNRDQRQQLYDSWRKYATDYLASTGNLLTREDIDYAQNYFNDVAETEGLRRPDYTPPGYAQQLIEQGQSGLRSFQSGLAGYGALIGAADPDEVAGAIVSRNREEDQRYISPEFKEYSQKQLGFFGAAKELITNPFDLVLPFFAQSLGSNLPALGASLTAGAAGAAVASPAVGAVTGLYTGAVLGGATDAVVTVGQLINDEVRKRGLDPLKPEDVASVLKDPEFKERALKESTARGLVIGATGLASLGLGQIVARPAAEIAKAGVGAVVREGGKQLAIQTVAEPVGETAAQVGAQIATGQPIEVRGREVAEETFVGLPTAAVEAGALTYSNLVQNNAPSTANEVLRESVTAFRQGELGKILGEPTTDQSIANFYDSLTIGEKARTLGLATNAILTQGQGSYANLSDAEKALVGQAFEGAKQATAPAVTAAEAEVKAAEEAQKALEEVPAPVVEAPAPVAEAPAPVAEAPAVAPVAEAPAPAPAPTPITEAPPIAEAPKAELGTVAPATAAVVEAEAPAPVDLGETEQKIIELQKAKTKDKTVQINNKPFSFKFREKIDEPNGVYYSPEITIPDTETTIPTLKTAILNSGAKNVKAQVLKSGELKVEWTPAATQANPNPEKLSYTYKPTTTAENKKVFIGDTFAATRLDEILSQKIVPAPTAKVLPPTKKQISALEKLGYLPADITALNRTQAKDIIAKQTPKVEAPKEAPQAPAPAGVTEAPAIAPAPVVEPPRAAPAQPEVGEAGGLVAPPAGGPATQETVEQRLAKADQKLTAVLEKLGGALDPDVKLDNATVTAYFGGVPDQQTQRKVQALLRLVTLGLSNAKQRLARAKGAGRNLGETFTNINKIVFTRDQTGGGGIYADPRNPFEAGTLYINPDQLTRALLTDLTRDPADFFASMLEEEIIHANHGKAMVRAFVQTFPAEQNPEIYASPQATLDAFTKFYDAQNKEIENSLTLDQIKRVVGRYAQSLGINMAGKTKEQIIQEFNVGRPGRLAEEYLRAFIQDRQLGAITEDQVKAYATRPILRALGALRNWFRDLVGKGVGRQSQKTFIDKQHDAILDLLLNSSQVELRAAQEETNTAIPGRILASSIDPFAQEIQRQNKQSKSELQAEIERELGEGGLWRRTIIGRLKKSYPVVDPAEVESLVYASVPEALGSFDEGRGTKFSTHLTNIANRKILREKMKTVRRQAREFVSFQAPGFYNVPTELRNAETVENEVEAEREDFTLDQLAEKVVTKAPTLEAEIKAQEKVAPVVEERAIAAAYDPETGKTNIAEEGQELEELTLADGEQISSLDAEVAEKRTAYIEAQLGEAGRLLAGAARALGLTKLETEILAYAADPEASALNRKQITDKYGLTNDQFTNMRDDVLNKMREQLGRAGVTRTADVLASSINLIPQYSEAVRTNNVEEAQALVDRAARLNGYNYGPVYHGSPVKNISQFKPSRNTVNKNYFHDYGPGIYVTNDQQYAREYTTPRGLLIDSILAGKDLRGEEGKVYKVYAKLSNPLEIKGEDVVPQNIYSAFRERVQQRGSEVAKEMLNDLYPEDAEGEFSFADILSEELASFMVNTLKSFGYDGIIAEAGREVVIWDPAQLKSADPFTYDENNQLIPLKERFNIGSPLLAYSIDPTQSQALARAKTTLPKDVAAEVNAVVKDPFTDEQLERQARDFVKANSPNGDVMHAKRILDGRPNMRFEERVATLAVIGKILRDRAFKVETNIEKSGNSPERTALRQYLNTNLKEVFSAAQELATRAGQELRAIRTANGIFLPYNWERLYTGPISEQQEEALKYKQEVIQLKAELERLRAVLARDAGNGISIDVPAGPDAPARIRVTPRPPEAPVPEGENFYQLLSLFGDLAPIEGENFADYLTRLGVPYDDVIAALEGVKAASVSATGVARIVPANLRSLPASEAIRQLVNIDKNFFGKLVSLRLKSGGGATQAEVVAGLERKKTDTKARPLELQTVFDFFNSTESTKPTSETTIDKDPLPPLVRLAKYASDTITDRIMRSLGADKTKTPSDSFTKLERQVRTLVNAQFKQETNPAQVSPEDTRSVEQRLLDMVQRISLAETVFNQVKAGLQEEIATDNRARELKAEGQLTAKQRAELEERATREFNPNAINTLDSLLRKVIDFKAEARKHMTQRGATIESLQNIITQKFPNFSETQAQALAKFLGARYAKLVEDARSKQLANIVRRVGEKETAMPKSKMQQIFELINLGAFDDATFYNAIAERYDLPEWDPAIAEEVRKRANKIQRLPKDSDQQLTESFLLNAFIANEHNKQRKGFEKVGRWLDVASSLWKAGVLSGPPTQLVNLGATHLNVLMELFAEANAYRKAAKAKGLDGKFNDFLGTGLAAYLDSVGRVGAEQAGDAFATGLTRFRNEKQTELTPLENFTFDTTKPWKPSNYIAAWKIVGRAMAAADTYNSVIANEAKARMAARYSMLVDGLTAEEATKRTNEIFDRNNATNKAIEEQVGQEEAQGQFGSLAGLDPKSSAYRSEKRKIEAGKRRRYAQLREQTAAREANIQDLTEIRKFTETATFNNQPQGLIGYIGGHIVGSMVGRVPILVPFAAFPRTIANIINAGLNYTPYGFARANGFSIGNAFGVVRDKGYAFAGPEKDSVEYHKLQTQALYGSIAIFTLIGLALKDMDKDWDDAFFAVTGRGPADPEKREQLRSAGWVENSVKFGPLRFKHTDFPGLNTIFGAMALISDEWRYGKLSERDFATIVTTAALGIGNSIFDKQLLSGAKTLFEAVSDRGDASTKAKRVIQSYAGGFLNPGFARWMTKTFNIGADGMVGVTDTKELNSTVGGFLLGLTPAAVIAGKPALNRLGEPLREYPYAATMKRFGFVPEVKEHPVFTPLVRAGLFVPGASINLKINDFENGKPIQRKMDQSEFYNYSKYNGEYLRRRLTPQKAEALARLAVRNQDAAQKQLEDLTRASKDYAKARIEAEIRLNRRRK